VSLLQVALTTVLQARRAAGAGLPPATTAKSRQIEVAGPLEKPQRLQRLPQQAPLASSATASLANLDTMRFTGDFTALDERLREQADLEATVLRKPDRGPPVTIDPTLIDRAFARPAPNRIDVRAELEQGYPHLLERITAIWSTGICALFARLDRRRAGGRQGFPFGVMSELLSLSALLETAE
jgi:hypothetical protein